jgi:hypothetical protein
MLAGFTIFILTDFKFDSYLFQNDFFINLKKYLKTILSYFFQFDNGELNEKVIPIDKVDNKIHI